MALAKLCESESSGSGSPALAPYST